MEAMPRPTHLKELLCRRTSAWYNSPTRAFRLPRRRPSGWPTGAAKVQPLGVSIKQTYWTLGHYDQVCVFEAPNDETAASVLLAADMLGNIRTQTLRAFTTSQMEKILTKVA